MARVAFLLFVDDGLNVTMIEQEVDGARGDMHEFVKAKSEGFRPVIVTD